MVESKPFPIIPLPKNQIIPLPRNFTPSIYENSKIFIENPVFDIEKSSELETCIICLDSTIEPERIKPCKTCNTYMHDKCFIEYSKARLPPKTR